MPKRFHQALEDALAATGTPLKRVSETTGVSYDQLLKVRQRKSGTNVDDAVKVAHFFGLTLDEFLEDNTAILRSEAAALFRKLSDAERNILLAAAAGRRALGQGEDP